MEVRSNHVFTRAIASQGAGGFHVVKSFSSEGAMKRRTIRARSRNLFAACLAQQLEPRRLLAAATVYVNDNWQEVVDVGPPGPSTGDVVQSPASDTDVGQHVMDVDAFTTVADGIAKIG